MNKYAYGIDVGGTAIKYGFFDNNGVMIRKWQTPTNVEDNGTYILNEISIEEGSLLCPNCGREYLIKNGIINMVLNDDEI